jgi:hypothetical protein
MFFGEPMMRVRDVFCEMNLALANGVAELPFFGAHRDKQFVFEKLQSSEQRVELVVYVSVAPEPGLVPAQAPG